MDLLNLTFPGISAMAAATLGSGLFVLMTFFVNACIAVGSVHRGLAKSGRIELARPRGARICSGVACGERGCCMAGGALAGCGAALGRMARGAAALALVAGACAAAASVINSSTSFALVLLCAAAGICFFSAAVTLGAVAGRGRSRGFLHACAVVVSPLAAATSTAGAIAASFLTSGTASGLATAALAAVAALAAGTAAAGSAYLFVLWWHPSFRSPYQQGPNSALAWEWPRPPSVRSAGCIGCFFEGDGEGGDDTAAFDGDAESANAPLVPKEFNSAPTPTAPAYERAPTPSLALALGFPRVAITPVHAPPLPSAPSLMSPSDSPRSPPVLSPLSSPTHAPDNAAIRAAAARAVAALGGPAPMEPPAETATAIAIRAAVALLSSPPPVTPFRSATAAAAAAAATTSTPAPAAYTSTAALYEQPSPAPVSLLPMSPDMDVTSPTSGWQAGVTSPVYSPPPAPLSQGGRGKKKKTVGSSSPLEEGELPSP